MRCPLTERSEAVGGNPRLFAGSRTVAEIRRGPFGDETYYFHQDHQGSPETISNDNAIAFRQEFDAFGLIQGIPPEPNQELTRAGFTGHDHDYDLGVVDMGGRIYDPVAGQFMSADPIMQAPFWSQGLNRWAYVFNDPVNLTDPSGFMTSQTGHEVAGAVGVLAGNPFSATAIAVLVQGAGVGVAIPVVGAAINVGITGAMNPFGGSQAATYNVAAPSGAPKTTATARNSLDPLSQRAQPGPAAKERPPESYAAVAKNAVPCKHSPEECRQIALDTQLSLTPVGVVVRGNQAAAGTVVRFFSWLSSRFGARVLTNQLPHLFAAESAAAARVGAAPIEATDQSLSKVANSGTLKWVVTEGGELVVSPHTVKGVEISHAVLSGGKPVLAAGHAEIAAGGSKFVGLSINASSGHFGQGVVDVGKAAFARLGVAF